MKNFKHMTSKYYLSRSFTFLRIRLAIWSIPLWAAYIVMLAVFIAAALKTSSWVAGNYYIAGFVALVGISIFLEPQNRADFANWLGLVPMNVKSSGLPSRLPNKMLTVTRYFCYLVIAGYLATLTWFTVMNDFNTDKSATIDWLIHLLLALLGVIGFGELTVRKTRIPLILAGICFLLLIRLIVKWWMNTQNPVIM